MEFRQHDHQVNTRGGAMNGRSNDDEQTDRLDDETDRTEVSRRALLRTALFGAAAIPIGAGVAAQGTPTASPQAVSGTPVGTPQAKPTAGGPTAIGLDSAETWAEPWIWRPGEWPGQQLELNVVENENPGPIVGFGNASAVLFSYNGATPGPTIRMRGDETLSIRLRNLLGQNFGATHIGPYPDPPGLPPWVSAADVMAKSEQLGLLRSDFCLGEHTNGVHSTRVTNLHTHGIHVRPGQNPDGTISDNVLFRLMDQADYEKRQEEAGSPTCHWLRDPEQTTYLRDEEQAGYADYEIRIGDVQAREREALGLPPQPHPPGTHWYHPHCHGATHNQVASGMAGFLIIEGDVDEAINQAMTGEPHPDPQFKLGSYDYIERVMLIQRVFVIASDPDAHTRELKRGGSGASPSVNGDQTPMIISMRPGAIERWRVLNGSVDGQGFKRFMVLKGQYDVEESSANGGTVSTLVKLRDASTNTFSPATRAEVSADKQQLYQLAFDGVTLLDGNDRSATYTIKNLAEQNAGTTNPLDTELTGNPNQAMLANFEACYANAEGIRNCYV